MKPYLALVFLCFLGCVRVEAQQFDPLHPPNSFRTTANPHYWNNAPPYPGYWQQDVHYAIQGRLDEDSDVLDAAMELRYWNNSPDSLHHVFFHLYQEAYQDGSYMKDGARPRKEPRNAGTTIGSLKVNGNEVPFEQDNTIVKVALPRALPPNSELVFQVTFRTHFVMGLGRRMKLFNSSGFKHYDGVHWYPRISVYDRHAGWDTDQHFGHEFYGDFGTFDVELDLPNDQVMDATGWLQNPEEVLPDELLRRLDIRNFTDKDPSEPVTVITPYVQGERKVWRFHAENVHDFAFTCDPTYRIGVSEWNGVKCVALVQEPHAAGWQNAAEYTAKIIEVFSRDFGMYAYPKMIVADARDGMEYPMLTLDSGQDPDYRGLLVHEVGHNWFFGMLGNNETYRAMLDEGFTQFLTVWGLEAIDGDTLVVDPPGNFYEAKYRTPPLAREDELYYGYQRDAVIDELPPIDVHSDEFDLVQGRGMGYGHVYYKTGVMLYNLQYVLGEELFLAAMQNYVDAWKIKHPTVEDFRNSIIRSTGVDLNWFFDQWITTDHRIDYAVGRIRHKGQDGGQEITLHRRGDMHMPLDLRVEARDGSRHDFHIPNTWFEKRTEATILPRWIGSADRARTYVAKVDIPSGIRMVTIDTTHRLADAYKLNDRSRPPVELTYDHLLSVRPDRKKYELFGRPDLWYNGFDGLKAGVHLNGNYMQRKHKLWLTAWLNTGLVQSLPDGRVDTRYDAFSYNFRYETSTERLLKGSSVHVQARHLDGLELYGGGMEWRSESGRTRVAADIRYFIRRDSSDLTYLLYPEEWSLNTWSGLLDLTIQRTYSEATDRGVVELRLRQGMVGSASGSNVRITNWNKVPIAGLQLRIRSIAQYGTGGSDVEGSLYLAGLAPMNLVENKFVRSIGLVPYEMVGAFGADLSNFQQSGGLNLRGYAGYLAPEETSSGAVVYTYRGNSGAAINAELDLDGLVKWRPRLTAPWLHLDAYLFGDVGSMGFREVRENGSTRFRMAAPRADAGVGAALTIKRWGPLDKLKPFTIRFDMPLFISALPATESDHFAFRYVFGVGRTF
ncbi:MAG: M1 family metallopeptidase [Flavobacteriales bacterium]|nr:M1 family metallopeptidase [Flavobacteriales bacterium]